MSVDLWFDEDNVDKQNDKIVLNVLVRELLALVLNVSLRAGNSGGYALSEADVVL